MQGATYLKKELGVFLRTMRKRNKQTLPEIATRLGFDSVNFLSRIERGDATIPIDRIADIAATYQIDPVTFARVALAVHHADVFDLLRWYVRQDADFCNRTSSLHTSKPDTKRKHDVWLKSTMLREALDSIRTLMLENEQHVPKAEWRKEGYFVDPELEFEKTRGKK